MFVPLSGDEKALAEAASGNASALIEKLPTPHNGRYEYYDDKGDLCFVVQRDKKKRQEQKKRQKALWFIHSYPA